MREQGHKRTHYGLEHHGITSETGTIYWNLTTPELYEEIIRRREGVLSERGALIVDTGEHTGRAAQDKAIVREPSSEDKIWWGEINRPFPQERFNALRDRMIEYMRTRDIFVQDVFAGADPRYRLSVRVITELAWHSLFARTLFIVERQHGFVPDFTIINLPGFRAIPERDGTRTGTFILLDFGQRLVMIGGTSYAGETKKSIFTVLNYLLPPRGVLSMHCSANVGERGDVSLFFGLSGTGKTTLSADPNRRLIGDDEHGWSDDGIFNFEGGCYAKVIRLNPQAEPDIYRAAQSFGTILENVIYNRETRALDFDDASKTENTRAAYPLSCLPKIVTEGMAGHPNNIIMLTADAFGVLPPVARLTQEQAMYHFLSGYTAKVAGTEKGVREPQATFSTCFGAPFLVLPPAVYAEMLGQRMKRHGTDCWLVNTGWSGGPYGEGERIKIAYTRAIIRAIQSGALAQVALRPDPIFGILVPRSCPDVPTEILDPRNTWRDKEAYDRKARELARRFNQNFEKYAREVSADVRATAPVAD